MLWCVVVVVVVGGGGGNKGGWQRFDACQHCLVAVVSFLFFSVAAVDAVVVFDAVASVDAVAIVVVDVVAAAVDAGFGIEVRGHCNSA